MNWILPSQRLPAHNETVLVCNDNNVELAYFDEREGKFVLKSGGFYNTSADIAWLEMLRPNENTI